MTHAARGPVTATSVRAGNLNEDTSPDTAANPILRVFELADEFGIPTSRILEELGKLGCKAQSDLATVDSGWIEPLRQRLAAAAEVDRLIVLQRSSSSQRSRTGDLTGPRPAALLLRDPSGSFQFTVLPGDVVGREATGRAQLHGTTGISRFHCRFDWDAAGDNWTITDLRSSNGTSVRGRSLRPDEPEVVRPGDLVTLDLLTLQLVSPDDLEEGAKETTRLGR